MSTLCKEIDFLACLQYRKLRSRKHTTCNKAQTIFFILLSPVSYTHLDVYKRQGYTLSEVPIIKKISAVSAYSIAVSIIGTDSPNHTMNGRKDVYKRQMRRTSHFEERQVRHFLWMFKLSHMQVYHKLINSNSCFI